MSLVEIEDTELASYKQVTNVMQQMLNNPKTRRQILEAQKTLNPNMVIPELDAAEPLREEFAKLNSRLDEFATSQAADKAEREKEKRMSELQSRWDRGRAGLRSSGYTDEGLTEVEKFMEEKGIADHEIGAAAFEKLHPAHEPIKATGGNRFDIFEPADRTSEHMKALCENPDNEMALNAAINDTLRVARGR